MDARYALDGANASALELETFYSGFSATTTGSGVGLTSEADYDTWNVMASWLVKAKMGWFQPYIGLGAGASYISRSNATASVPGFNGTVESDDDLVFAMQAIVGADMYLNDQWSLFTEYKYLMAFDPTFSGIATDPTIPLSTPTTASYDMIGQHLLVFGVKYGF